MKKLGTRNVTLLLMGAKMTGTFEEAYSYIEESLYVNEADTIFEFCLWLDVEIGGAGANNIERLFEAFINPDNKEAVEFSLEVKKKIAEMRSRH